MAGSPSEQYRLVTNTLSTLTVRLDQSRDESVILRKQLDEDRAAGRERDSAHAELVRDLTQNVAGLVERDATRRFELEELKGRFRQEVGERRVAEEKARDEATQLRRELADARQETALVKQLLQEHIKKTELADSRRWGLVVLSLGAIFSLTAGLILALVKK